MAFTQQKFTAWYKLRETDKGKKAAPGTGDYQRWDYLKEGHLPAKHEVGVPSSRLKSLKKSCDPTEPRLQEEYARFQKYGAHATARMQNLVAFEYRNGNAVFPDRQPPLEPARNRKHATQDPAALLADDHRRKRVGSGPEWASRYHVEFDEKESASIQRRYSARRIADANQTASFVGLHNAALRSQGVRDNFRSYDHFTNAERSPELEASEWIKPPSAPKPRDSNTILGGPVEATREESGGWAHHYRHRRAQTRNPITTGEEPAPLSRPIRGREYNPIAHFQPESFSYTSPAPAPTTAPASTTTSAAVTVAALPVASP